MFQKIFWRRERACGKPRRESKEPVHELMDDLRPHARNSRFRDLKVGQQPEGLISRELRQFSDQFLQLFFLETIEKEQGYDQIVRFFLCIPYERIGVNKFHLGGIESDFFQTLPGQ